MEWAVDEKNEKLLWVRVLEWVARLASIGTLYRISP
jgi:hypothetical protein